MDDRGGRGWFVATTPNCRIERVPARGAKHVHAVDINPVLGLTHKMILKKGLRNVIPCKADVARLPFKSHCFDLLLCLSLIEHIQDQEQTLVEFKRVLRTDGTMVLGYPLQNLPQRVFEGLNRNIQFAKLFIQLPTSQAIIRIKESKQFPHDHVSDFSNVKKKAQVNFVLRDCVVIKLLGLSVYEIVLLRP